MIVLVRNAASKYFYCLIMRVSLCTSCHAAYDLSVRVVTIFVLILVFVNKNTTDLHYSAALHFIHRCIAIWPLTAHSLRGSAGLIWLKWLLIYRNYMCMATTSITHLGTNRARRKITAASSIPSRYSLV